MDPEYQRQLQVLFELRDMLLEIYSSNTESDTENYITANELFNKLERIIREEAEEIELISKSKTEI